MVRNTLVHTHTHTFCGVLFALFYLPLGWVYVFMLGVQVGRPPPVVATEHDVVISMPNALVHPLFFFLIKHTQCCCVSVLVYRWKLFQKLLHSWSRPVDALSILVLNRYT